MYHKIDNKKRTILENLNEHLQIQATRLINVGLETSILPEYNIHIKDDKKAICSNRSYKISNKTFTIASNNKKPVERSHWKNPNKPIRKLKPYNPLYTWNRGGRLKELRIRCQARKFFYIWRNRTVGHVTYLKAEHYYRGKLMRKVWKIWYDQYWRLRVEPRLFGKAIIFRNAVLLRSVFTAWNSWIKCRSLYYLKLETAVKFHRDHMKKVAFDNWVSWIIVQKCKTKLNVLAGSWTRKQSLTFCFSTWKELWYLKLDENSKMCSANFHFNMALMNKTFHAWFEVVPILRHLKLNDSKAEGNYKSVIMKKTFDQWIQFHQKQRSKLKEKDKWNDHYHWNLAYRCLSTWKNLYTRSLVHSAIQIKTTNLATSFQLQRYFSIWKKYHIDEKNRIEKRKSADELRDTMIKKRAWNKIVLFIRTTRQKTEMKKKAERCSNCLTLKRHLNLWMKRLEEKNNYDRRLQFGAARSHYRRFLFKKYLREWSRYTGISIEKSNRLVVANTMHQINLKKKIMKSWLEYVTLSKEKTRLKMMEKHFIWEHGIAKHWQMWRNQFIDRQLLNTRLAEHLKHQETLKKREIFQKWLVGKNAKIKEKHLNDKASLHFRHQLLWKYFLAISNYIEYRDKKRIYNDLADMHSQQQLICQSFHHWRDYCSTKREQRKLIFSRFHKVQYNLKLITFTSWKTFVTESKKTRYLSDYLFEEKIQKLARQALLAWNFYAKNQRAKKTQTQDKVAECRAHLSEINKRRLLQHWREKAALVLAENLKIRRATEFFQYKCQLKSFSIWKLYSEHCKRKHSQRLQSSWFRQRADQARVWIIWRQALCDRQRDQYYTRYALVHWSWKLQTKVFRAWQKYSVEQHEMTQKENHAFHIYKNRLKIYSLRQWLMSADFLSQWCNEHRKIGTTGSSGLVKAVEQWKRFTQMKTNKQPSTYKPSLSALHPDIEKSDLKLCQKSKFHHSKLRPRPKVPDFLNTAPEPKQSTRLQEQHLVPRGATQSLAFKQADLPDDVLLPPTCFQFHSNENDDDIRTTSSTKENLLEEIKQIKKSLEHYKESSVILRDLEAELAQYDETLARMSPRNDSSFYQEFDPVIYRDRLSSTINELKEEMTRQKPICVQLTKRFQEIMKILNP